MKLTRKQKRAENKRRARMYRRMKVTTYDDLIARDRNPKRRYTATAVIGGKMDILGQLQNAWRFGSSAEYEAAKRLYEREVGSVPWSYQSKRRNPIVKFKARGKRVRFYAKPKRRGKVPKQLRKHVYKRRR